MAKHRDEQAIVESDMAQRWAAMTSLVRSLDWKRVSAIVSRDPQSWDKMPVCLRGVVWRLANMAMDQVCMEIGRAEALEESR